MVNRQVLLAAAASFVVGVSPGWAHITCGQPPFDDSAALSEVYDALSDIVAPFSGLAKVLNNDLTLCLSDAMLVERGYYQPDGRKLVLADDMTPGLTLAVAVHELRHAEQFDTGSCPGLDLAMRDYAQGVFALEADASVTSFVVAAYHRAQGRAAMWDALAAWPMQADLAATFDAKLADTTDITAAASAAFAAWYDREDRKRNYYVAVCSNYLDELDRDHLVPQYNSLPDGYYAALCRLPDGRPYLCSADRE